MKKLKYQQFFEENTTECDISYRGGTLKFDVSSLFDTGEEPAIMGAYQNYMGGGIAGSIQSGRMFDISKFSKKDKKIYDQLAEEIKQYFYSLNNGGGDDYMQENITGGGRKGYNKLQKMPSHYPGL